MTSADPAYAAWRRDQRKHLIALRESIDPGHLQAWRVAIDGHLRRSFPGLGGTMLAICWPYRNEYDARHLAAGLRSFGTTTLLPVVVARATALQFREWHPGVAMSKGALGIPYPSSTPQCQPRVVADISTALWRRCNRGPQLLAWHMNWRVSKQSIRNPTTLRWITW